MMGLFAGFGLLGLALTGLLLFGVGYLGYRLGGGWGIAIAFALLLGVQLFFPSPKPAATPAPGRVA